MNFRKNKIIIILMLLIVLVSVFYNHNKFSIDNYEFNFNNKYNNYSFKESLLFESQTIEDYDNLQELMSNSRAMALYNNYIIVNISFFTIAFKLKNTAVINQIYRINNDSVFIVVYNHKTDGKKHVELI